MSTVDAADAHLLRVLDDGFEAIRVRAGEHLACRVGCDACCHGPFPITRLDARRLARGLADLRREDPARAARVAARAARAVETLHEDYPGNTRTGALEQDEGRLDRFFERHAGLPCPALTAEEGRCELYAWRPVSCRTYGPPARFGPIDSPPCELCFTRATPGEIEACRFEPDTEGLEQALLSRIGWAGGEDWETLVAFALLDSPVEGRR